VLNIVAPGLGSIVAGYNDLNGCNRRSVYYGFFQMLLTIVVVGAVWSIIFGFEIYNKSNEEFDKYKLIKVSFDRPPPE